MKCAVVRPPSAERCGARATHKIVWSDGDASHACADCAVFIRQLVEAHTPRAIAAPPKIEKLP